MELREREIKLKQQIRIGTDGFRLSNYASTLLLFTLFLNAGCSTSKIAVIDRPVIAHVTGERVVESLGISIRGLVLSSAGYMLDLRYRVMDPEKAAPLMDKKVKPYLIVEATGAKLEIPITPKVGTLRQVPRNDNVAKERDYFIMFTNAGHRLHSGDKVNLFIGETRIENLSIQ